MLSCLQVLRHILRHRPLKHERETLLSAPAQTQSTLKLHEKDIVVSPTNVAHLCSLVGYDTESSHFVQNFWRIFNFFSFQGQSVFHSSTILP